MLSKHADPPLSEPLVDQPNKFRDLIEDHVPHHWIYKDHNIHYCYYQTKHITFGLSFVTAIQALLTSLVEGRPEPD